MQIAFGLAERRARRARPTTNPPSQGILIGRAVSPKPPFHPQRRAYCSVTSVTAPDTLKTSARRIVGRHRLKRSDPETDDARSSSPAHQIRPANRFQPTVQNNAAGYYRKPAWSVGSRRRRSRGPLLPHSCLRSPLPEHHPCRAQANGRSPDPRPVPRWADPFHPVESPPLLFRSARLSPPGPPRPSPHKPCG